VPWNIGAGLTTVSQNIGYGIHGTSSALSNYGGVNQILNQNICRTDILQPLNPLIKP
jgi:hypothetical protein